MSVTKVLVVQPSDLVPLGTLADWLTEAGAQIEIVRPASKQIPSTAEGYAAVICLGGEMNAYQDADYPWLAPVRALLASAASRNIPLLGICLGGQLVAAATGGQVRRGAQGPEVGTLLVAKRDAAAHDPLFADLPMTPDVVQFHADEIAALPPGAVLLASSPRYAHQAFRVGTCTYGLQFHIESNPDIVKLWQQSWPELAATAKQSNFADEHLIAIHNDIAETWKPFIARFIQLAQGQLTHAASGKQLPVV